MVRDTSFDGTTGGCLHISAIMLCMLALNRQERVRRLSDELQGGLIVVAGYKQMQLSGDMAAPFLQEANMWWLTGIEEPGWKAIVDGSRKALILVRPHRSKLQVVFDGRLTVEEALKISGARDVIDEDVFEQTLRQLRRAHPLVHMPIDTREYGFVANPASHELKATLERVFETVQDCTEAFAALRAVKSDDELAMMKKAARLTCSAFESVRERLANYRFEYEIEADFTAAFRRQNALHAYEPIVASGENAVTLHYVANSARLAKNSLVLIDIGARVGGYAADVTRTYAVNPTARQIQVHSAVEKAQKKIIALIAPGLLVREYLQRVDEIMKDALEEIGLLPDRTNDDVYRKYFPHAISHGLGVDVHDSLGKPRMFEPGMVITVEPGIYIEEESIGVRIEDDILVTKTGHSNLTARLSTSL